MQDSWQHYQHTTLTTSGSDHVWVTPLLMKTTLNPTAAENYRALSLPPVRTETLERAERVRSQLFSNRTTYMKTVWPQKQMKEGHPELNRAKTELIYPCKPVSRSQHRCTARVYNTNTNQHSKQQWVVFDSHLKDSYVRMWKQQPILEHQQN